MTEASRKIMAGDLSQRLPFGGSGDEFDRMSDSLNTMLERIERLNEGLRQVSDNIAHDLKTPLTRLRNKAADAIDSGDGEGRRVALEGIIGESDQLIRTFNALLMISRVEAGSMAAEMSAVDLSSIVGDSAELYEPVAEEAGLTLKAEIEPGIEVQGNRELIGQAIFNLIDNADQIRGRLPWRGRDDAQAATWRRRRAALRRRPRTWRAGRQARRRGETLLPAGRKPIQARNGSRAFTGRGGDGAARRPSRAFRYGPGRAKRAGTDRHHSLPRGERLRSGVKAPSCVCRCDLGLRITL